MNEYELPPHRHQFTPDQIRTMAAAVAEAEATVDGEGDTSVSSVGVARLAPSAGALGNLVSIEIRGFDRGYDVSVRSFVMDEDGRILASTGRERATSAE